MTVSTALLDRLKELRAKATPGPWSTIHVTLSSHIYGNGSDQRLAQTHQYSFGGGPDHEARKANAALIVELVNNADALLTAAAAGAWRPTREEIARIIDPFAMDTSFDADGRYKALAAADAILALSPPTPEAKP